MHTVCECPHTDVFEVWMAKGVFVGRRRDRNRKPQVRKQIGGRPFHLQRVWCCSVALYHKQTKTVSIALMSWWGNRGMMLDVVTRIVVGRYY